MIIKNVKSNYTYCKEVITTINGRIRKKLSVLDVSEKTLTEKREIITKRLLRVYGAIPDGVRFSKRKTKDPFNPDGYRIFVMCDWIKRNRYYDEKGKFKIGSLIYAINKQIEGKTNKNILIMDKT